MNSPHGMPRRRRHQPITEALDRVLHAQLFVEVDLAAIGYAEEGRGELASLTHLAALSADPEWRRILTQLRLLQDSPFFHAIYVRPDKVDIEIVTCLLIGDRSLDLATATSEFRHVTEVIRPLRELVGRFHLDEDTATALTSSGGALEARGVRGAAAFAEAACAFARLTPRTATGVAFFVCLDGVDEAVRTVGFDWPLCRVDIHLLAPNEYFGSFVWDVSGDSLVGAAGGTELTDAGLAEALTYQLENAPIRHR